MQGAYSGIRYLRHYMHASGAGGIHSPSIFRLYTEVIRERAWQRDPAYRQYLQDLKGSTTQSVRKSRRKAGDHQETVPPASDPYHSYGLNTALLSKDLRLLYRISQHMKPARILSLGTDAMAPALAMQHGCPSAEVRVIRSWEDNFADGRPRQDGLAAAWAGQEVLLPDWRAHHESPDLVCLATGGDAAPLLDMAQALLSRLHQHGLIVVRGIHLNREMAYAWERITCFPEVTVSIDLFDAGIIFVSEDLGYMQYTLRY